jgi:membrane protein DedA with SNARE-associated domain
MSSEIVHYLTEYGYLAIFILVFLQEIGMPNPVPNELLLIFSGYLSFKGILFLPLVLLTAVAADFIGTNILYFIFYYAGAVILAKKPKWFPVSEKTLSNLSKKISSGRNYNIFIFRLTPFTRGYTSVLTGLFRISPGVFLPIALFSAITWAFVYVIAGYLAGPSWNLFSQYLGSFKYIMAAILLLTISAVLIVQLTKKRKKSGAGTSETETSQTLLTQT